MTPPLSETSDSRGEPVIPYSTDAMADWPSGIPRPIVILVKTSASFGQQLIGARYEVLAKPGIDPDEHRVLAYRMLKRAMPDENPMEWTVSSR